jgi:hypothetical protein
MHTGMYRDASLKQPTIVKYTQSTKQHSRREREEGRKKDNLSKNELLSCMLPPYLLADKIELDPTL